LDRIRALYSWKIRKLGGECFARIGLKSAFSVMHGCFTDDLEHDQRCAVSSNNRRKSIKEIGSFDQLLCLLKVQFLMASSDLELTAIAFSSKNAAVNIFGDSCKCSMQNIDIRPTNHMKFSGLVTHGMEKTRYSTTMQNPCDPRVVEKNAQPL
jgi:hypothetical protein